MNTGVTLTQADIQMANAIYARTYDCSNMREAIQALKTLEGVSTSIENETEVDGVLMVDVYAIYRDIRYWIGVMPAFAPAPPTDHGVA